ncbi:transposase [Oxalobacteraceae bacterium]|nr:transposase [Oxalobacteraceae bacterium]
MRQRRLCLPGIPLHIVQRGNNRQTVFFSHRDYLHYLALLRELSQQLQCLIHAYVLMPNHVHLLISSAEATAPSALMNALDQRYGQYVNWRYQRSGGLWQGRFKSSFIQEERYLMVCQRYIELNPVRAGMVLFSGGYRWSSYRCNADGKADRITQPHFLYQSLGLDQQSRCAAYRSLFAQAMGNGDIAGLRGATDGEFAFGDQAFLAELARLRDASKPTA